MPSSALKELDLLQAEFATVYTSKNELDLVSGSSILKSGTLKIKVKFIDEKILQSAKAVKSGAEKLSRLSKIKERSLCAS